MKVNGDIRIATATCILVMAVAVKIANGNAATVIIKVDLEALPLLARQEFHSKSDAGLQGRFLEACMKRAHFSPSIRGAIAVDFEADENGSPCDK